MTMTLCAYDVRCSEQLGASFTAQGNTFSELCEFIKKCRNIHQYIWAMITGHQVQQGIIQNSGEEKSGKKLNKSPGQQTAKREKGQLPKSGANIQVAEERMWTSQGGKRNLEKGGTSKRTDRRAVRRLSCPNEAKDHTMTSFGEWRQTKNSPN